MTTASVVAELRGVSKTYGKVNALNNVDLNICAGEVVALLGPNGAGKTTAVGLLLGLLQPTRGEVRVFDNAPQQSESRTRIGAMLQLSGVPDTLKVREHIKLYSSYYPVPFSLEKTLELASLSALAERPYGKLSGGQKQRLHLALALCGNPDLIFLDEPTTGLDVATRRALWEQIRGFISRGRTVVLTTHYLDEADALADRVVVMNHGEVIAEGSPADIKSKTAGRKIRVISSLPAQEIRAMKGVTSLTSDGAAFEILVTAAEPVVLQLLTRDPAASDLTVTTAGLEDAFLALTNQEIRRAA